MTTLTTPSFEDYLAAAGITARQTDSGTRYTDADGNNISQSRIDDIKQQVSQALPAGTISLDPGKFIGGDPNTLNYFNQQYGTNFQSPTDYANYLYGPGQTINDPTYGNLYQPTTPYTGNTLNPALSYSPKGSFMEDNGWMLPLAIGTAGLAMGPGMAGAGVVDPWAAEGAFSAMPTGAGVGTGAGALGALTQAAAPVTELGQAASAADIARLAGTGLPGWLSPLTSLAQPALTPTSTDPFANPDVMNNMTLPDAQFPADATNGVANAAIGSVLSRILSGNPNAGDWAQLLGTGAATGLGLYGANQQSNAYQDMFNQYLGLGAPSRQRLEASYAPGFSVANDPGYQDALNNTTNTFLRSASAGNAPGVSGGNPFSNPGAWAETMKYVNSNVALPYLQNYRAQNAASGGLGVSQSTPSAAGIGQSAGGGANALGYGLSQLTTPQNSISDLMKQFSQMNNSYNPARSGFGV